MKDTLIAAKGIGLAAPQVGVLRRVVLVDNGEKILELINPEIIKTEGEQTGFEACLSVPGKYGTVTRPMKVTIKALDRNGKEYTVTGEELVARAFCHEIDHLNGVLYTDKATEVLDKSEIEEDE
jgi:peptide deformylase